MEYTEVTNAVYADPDNKTISCLVQFDKFPNPLPFLAMKDDVEPHGNKIWNELKNGDHGEIAAYVVPTPSPQQAYTAAIAAGLAITSKTDPTLNATYSVADADVQTITNQAQYVNLYSTFTSGATFAYPDAKNVVHTFTTTAIFMAFAKAVAQYVGACAQALTLSQAGTATKFPTSTVEIG
jgi:hypothetical protein